MFEDATNFNQPINTVGDKWNTSNVTNMYAMFYKATAFDQNISGWDTSNCASMDYMFNDSPFFQDISGWVVQNTCSTGRMFHGSLRADNTTVVRMNRVYVPSGQNAPLSVGIRAMKPAWKNGVAGWLPNGTFNSENN